MRLLWIAVAFAACTPVDRVPPRPPRQDPARSAAAVSAARAGQFEVARREADRVLAATPGDSAAAAVRAISRYQAAGARLVNDLDSVTTMGDKLNFLDHEKGRATWLAFLGELEAVDKDLAVTAADPSFSLELCLACWEYDWNRSGAIDDRDRKVFELEYNGNGGELAEGDPRRRPTYHFDIGDALWARAMISFQRGLVELVLAYKWSELDKLFSQGLGDGAITIKLIDKGRVKRAHNLFVSAIAFSAEERQAYLHETDDDREWVPNPRQKNYAMPLPVDDTLYATWSALLGDAQRLLASQEGISMRELGRFVVGSSDAALLPDAYVDLGRMLREPKDIVIAIDDDGPSKAANIDRALRGLLGNGYAKSMRASPLVGRLRHMKDDLERGGDSIERKLRYFLWLN